MSVGKHGLGRGISSLIGDYEQQTDFEAKNLESVGVKIVDIDIEYLRPNPNQPRKNFDPEALAELSQSIRIQGVIQPLLVEKISENNYVIVAGERRYRAARLAELKKVPCLVRTFTDVQRMEISLIENIQRENLNPVEEAKAYQYLLSKQEIKQEDLAQRLGKSRTTIANSLRLLNLPSSMLDSLKAGQFTAGHARALLSVENPADRELLYQRILKDQLSVRVAEKQANDLNKGSRAINNQLNLGLDSVKNKTEEIMEVEEKFLSATGCKVELKGKVSKGKVVIPFDSTDELERIYQLLGASDNLFDN